MNETIALRLKHFGHQLPVAGGAAGSYTPALRIGSLAIFSGQVSRASKGRVGADFSVSQGKMAAAEAALSLLAQIDKFVDGDISKIRRIARLGVFVAATSDFTEHSQVGNGASDLFVEVFGEIGRHARTTIGVASLPSGAAVEVDAIIELLE